MTISVLFHVNHLWGVGHFTRTAAIANAVVERGDAATIIAGNTPVPGRLDRRVKLIELPPLRAPDPSYSRLVGVGGKAPSLSHWQLRRNLIRDGLDSVAPDIVVTETFPFGRRKLADELLHLIVAAKSHGAAVVASIRDLPTAPSDAKKLDECAARLRDHYDAVLIHGDPAIVPLQDVWPGDIPATTCFTGYVTPPPPATGRRRGVVVSAGGGNDAAALLLNALAARRDNALAHEPWTFVVGPSAPTDLFVTLRQGLGPSDTVLMSTNDLPRHIAGAVLSISRGGYNTVCETVGSATRSIVVPFAPPGEPEQSIRARLFAAQHLLTQLDESELTPPALAAAISHALALPPPDPARLNLNGAAHSAGRLAEIAASR